MRIAITGAAGFIGYHCCARLIERGDRVTALDCLDDYYDVALKRARLARLEQRPGFRFHLLDICEHEPLGRVLRQVHPDVVLHFAARPGVRSSLSEPRPCISNNLVGFGNLLEACVAARVPHLIYASSSSVYGTHARTPFRVDHDCSHPASLYGATKRANELMAHAYSHLHGLPTTGLRLFTVYGPWGRPDMALFSFTRAILAGEPINVFAGGTLRRSFTYIDDMVEGAVRLLERPPEHREADGSTEQRPSESTAPFRLFNLGNPNAIPLTRFIDALERCIGRKAIRRDLPCPATELDATEADVHKLEQLVGQLPRTPLEQGIERFVRWYRDYHGTAHHDHLPEGPRR